MSQPFEQLGKESLTSMQILQLLEKVYDILLSIEHLHRDQPPPEDNDAYLSWFAIFPDVFA